MFRGALSRVFLSRPPLRPFLRSLSGLSDAMRARRTYPGEENKLRGHVERGVYGIGQKNVAVYMSRRITSLVYELLSWTLGVK